MRLQPATPDAFKLMMQGSAAFADIEQNGMRIDVPYLDRAIEKTGKLINELESGLRSDEVYSVWRRQFGEKIDLGSRAQLGTVIFDVLGVECTNRTSTGKPSTSEEALEGVDFPFVKNYLNLEKLKKVRGTFLLGLKNEVCDGIVHPYLNLHLVWTYRSSSDAPNLQNQPIRDPRQAYLIRSAYIPRDDDHVLLERDYGALEFRGAANFWNDESMLAYASDSTLDIHRDMAAECFDCTLQQASKPSTARAYAKNKCVFPLLYGSYYVSVARDLWQLTDRAGIKTSDGVPMYEHLASKGIHNYQQFEDHIKNVERKFNERFSHWSSEKNVWWNEYLKNGWFPLSTGFACQGVFSYNNLMNTPIQGPSFHLMLWSIIQINNWLKKYKMKTKIIMTIHDSILLDTYRKEMQDVLAYTEQVMTQDVRKHWRWIKTPLVVETDIAEKNWFLKKPLVA